MKRILFIFPLFLLFASVNVQADEGMWLPMFVERLNYTDMQKAGLKLTAEEIYSINQSSLKDAIVGLSNGPTPIGYFCTAEVVSDKGLLFTNHHCAYDVIQKHSSIEHDYLTDGFWAKDYSEELPNEGLTASFLIKMEDVTDSVLSVVTPDMTAEERAAAIRKKNSELRKTFNPDDKYHVVVKSFFEGNEYYLFMYEVFRDVRLVGTPPSAVGKFGGDTDNWMWPRHTGDFAVLRVYSAPDGSPADYDKDNIPLKPRHHLPISLDGVQKDDFAMIWGFPGSTDRYLTSYGVEFNMETQFPVIIDLFGKKLDVWKSFMDTDPKVNIQYASKHAMIANTWKYLIGQTRGLKRLDVSAKKEKAEQEFIKWVEVDATRLEQYGQVLPTLKDSYAAMQANLSPFLYNNLAGLGGAEILGYALGFNNLKELLKPVPKSELPKDKEMAAKMLADREEQLQKAIEDLRKDISTHFKDYYAPADQKVLQAMLVEYYNEVPFKMQATHVYKMFNQYKGSFEKYAAHLFEKSIFASEERINNFLNYPQLKVLEKDPAMILADAFMAKIIEASGSYRMAQAPMGEAKRLYIKALREMYPDKVFYPDANSTMRMTYGSVQDYFPADGIHYDFFTTQYGILEKEDPNDDEFIVPPYLKSLIDKQDFGPYGEDGTLAICFLSTNDITGGNSGSPVINGKGELIGLAFDGNWEAMSGDIAFEPELQRTINVDIRYVLFIIDKYAGATNLIDELTIHKAEPQPIRTEALDM
ncbi:MAG: S46 family peptidase [Bacteroidales bacterium]|nr:S46 family peptidase [Bacteroidales bacterium]